MIGIWRALTYPRRLREAQRRILATKRDMKIETEQQAIEAMQAVLAWTQQKPDTHFVGQTIGEHFQRGRVIASLTHDGTMGMATYPTAKDAAENSHEMERAYRNWMKPRDHAT